MQLIKINTALYRPALGALSRCIPKASRSTSDYGDVLEGLPSRADRTGNGICGTPVDDASSGGAGHCECCPAGDRGDWNQATVSSFFRGPDRSQATRSYSLLASGVGSVSAGHTPVILASTIPFHNWINWKCMIAELRKPHTSVAVPSCRVESRRRGKYVSTAIKRASAAPKPISLDRAPACPLP